MNRIKKYLWMVADKIKAFTIVNKESSSNNDFEIDDFDHRPYYRLVTDRLETEER